MKNEMKFEDGIKEIDVIIEKLESGDLELEESLKAYEKSMELIARCHKLLNDVEGRVKKILVEKDGVKFQDFE